MNKIPDFIPKTNDQPRKSRDFAVYVVDFATGLTASGGFKPSTLEGLEELRAWHQTLPRKLKKTLTVSGTLVGIRSKKGRGIRRRDVRFERWYRAVVKKERMDMTQRLLSNLKRSPLNPLERKEMLDTHSRYNTPAGVGIMRKMWRDHTFKFSKRTGLANDIVLGQAWITVEIEESKQEITFKFEECTRIRKGANNAV